MANKTKESTLAASGKWKKNNRQKHSKINNKWYHENKDKVSNSRKNIYKKNPSKSERIWSYYIGKTYGITQEHYNMMFKSQDGCCAICNRKDNKKRLAIDHCHNTGIIRGLLCVKCNTALCLLKEDISIFQKAQEYLLKNKNDK